MKYFYKVIDTYIVPSSPLPSHSQFQAVVTDPLFGRVQIFPRHTIILDRTHCSRPDFVTLPPPPAPTPLPMPSVNSSPTCLGFYDAIRRNFSEPLICRFLEDSCDLGVNCSLLITNAEYVLSVRYVTALGKFAFLVSDDSGRSLGTGVGVGVSVDLPYPPNSTVSFIQRSIAAGVRGFQVSSGNIGLGLGLGLVIFIHVVDLVNSLSFKFHYTRFWPPKSK